MVWRLAVLYGQDTRWREWSERARMGPLGLLIQGRGDPRLLEPEVSDVICVVLFPRFRMCVLYRLTSGYEIGEEGQRGWTEVFSPRSNHLPAQTYLDCMSIPKEDRPYFRAHRVQDEKATPRPEFKPHMVAPLRPYSALNPASPGSAGSQRFVPSVPHVDVAKFAPAPEAKFEPPMIETVLPAGFVPKPRKPSHSVVLPLDRLAPPPVVEPDVGAPLDYLLDFLVN